jgi:2-polyprenyl-3-methyl-5-hydroxy-6-metoxy-1,4-benzoquinol methylase
MSKQVGKIVKEAYRKLKGKPYVLSIEERLSDCKTILDLGCGSGSPIRGFSKNFHTVGVDLFKPAILESKNRKIHDDYVLADINNLCFRPDSFDAVVALDVLEHLKKALGLKLIKSMEELAKRKVVIIIPNGFVNQQEYDGNVLQAHLSGWTANEMKKMEYQVHGIVGLKLLRTEKANLKYCSLKLRTLVKNSHISFPVLLLNFYV